MASPEWHVDCVITKINAEELKQTGHDLAEPHVSQNKQQQRQIMPKETIAG